MVYIWKSNFLFNEGDIVGALDIDAISHSPFAELEILDSNFSFNKARLNSAKSPAVYIQSNSDVLLTLQGNYFGCNIADYNSGQPPLAISGTWSVVTISGNTIDPTCPYACNLGEYSLEGILNCTKCDYGHYSANTTAQSCHPCDAGSYAPDQGLSKCYPCEGGTYANSTGHEECWICSIGSYSTEGATSCTVCSGNTYQDNPKSSECKSCNGKAVDKVLCVACDTWFDGDGCTNLSYLSYGMIGGGALLVLIIVVTIVLVVCKKESTPKGDYALVRDSPVGEEKFV